jgi:type II secretory pathway pseudopilin PulG
LIVAIAIMGVLAAIAAPAALTFLDRGGAEAISTDQSKIQGSVDAFKADKHKGPDGAKKWGEQSNKRLYPTEDGKVGDLELSTGTKDADFADRNNWRVLQYVVGPSSGGDVSTSDITASQIWVGLLVNEPFANDGSGDEQDDPGYADPQAGEKGEYLLELPESASPGQSNTLTTGTYTWVLLHNGQLIPTYLSDTDSKWYTGYNGSFP